MNSKKLMLSICVAVAYLSVGSFALAQQAKDVKPAEGAKAKPAADAKPEMKLPEGWTEADMQACMEAGTPGKMHEHLTRDAGVWIGKTAMWMGPDTEPSQSECTMTLTPMMDGRFVKCEIAGDMPGMGPYVGFGIYGYDNVTQRFVTTWIDNCGTGMMNGTGELTPDGKVMTWTCTYNCPIQKKPTAMREVETTTGPNTKTFEMFGSDPKTGKEYKMMKIEYTRKS